jgi:penicillin amidase
METISTKGARVPFVAHRDQAGTPHVEAASWLDAIYALGYLHATDRPTQMLFSRAVAYGEAAGQIANKPDLLETDRFFRRAGLHLGLQRDVALARADVREQLDRYCQGVNDGLQDSGRSLPMWFTGFRPRPWQAESVLLIGNLLSFAGLAVGQQESERLLIDLVQTGIAADLLRELFAPYLDEVDLELLYDVRIERRLSGEALETLADLPRLAGSNAWAVSPLRSASGSALLAADPHLEINRLPAIWYEAVLSWGDGQYAMGATLPGCPLMAVGRTSRVAWGVTYLHADTIDLWIEDCRPTPSGRWQYRRGDRWHHFDVREEMIECKGAPSDTLRVFSNGQGTLLRDLTGESPGKYLASQWIGQSEGAHASIECWIDVLQAASAAELMDIAARNPHPTLVWVVADRDGHIGRQASGWLPHRAPGRTGLVPLPAWDESHHWIGKQPVESLPRLYDPPEGYVSSANENLDRIGERLIHSHGLPDYRKRRIVERLHSLTDATLQDMQHLQYDVKSLQARDLLKVFLPHCTTPELKTLLEEWDLRYHADSQAAAAFARLYQQVLLEVFGQEEGIGWRRMLYLCTRMGYSSMVLTAIDRLLQQEESLWWAGRDKGQLIAKAAQEVAALPATTWGEINSFHFANRFFEQSRVGRLFGFHSERRPLAGCQATPFQGHLLATARRESSFAPSYHLVTDLGTDEAWTNLPGGASESRFSRWYRNDVLAWEQGVYRLLKPRLLEAAPEAAPESAPARRGAATRASGQVSDAAAGDAAEDSSGGP